MIIGRHILIVEDEFVVANALRLLLEKAGYLVMGISLSASEAIAHINKKKPDLVLLDIFLQGDQTGIELSGHLAEANIPFIYISANSNQQIIEEAKETRPYGFIVKPFREKDVLVALEMALYRHAHSVEALLRKEQDLQIALLDTFSLPQSWDQTLGQVAKLFQSHIPFDLLLAGMKDDQNGKGITCFFRTGSEEYQVIRIPDLAVQSAVSPLKLNSFIDNETYSAGFYSGKNFLQMCQHHPFSQLLAKTFGFESAVINPIQTTRNGLFLLSFYSRNSNIYKSESLSLLKRLHQSLSLTLDRLLAFHEIEKLSEQLRRENRYLQDEVKTSANFEEIIGTSDPVLKVFDQVTQVASLDTSVILLGESGTGKELIARSIHNHSPRKGKLLVKVNCATLPANLIESELFGHEKGAFTGAVEKRIGKFELAQGGTIFLDEIGEMPLDLQVKLLRVLQEREIERIGGKATIKIDVRIIAATNRDLEKEVAEGRFRLDLYYRLNVFPIKLPVLRDRKSDIPLLANFFAQKFSKKTGKPFNGIHTTSMDGLLQYAWPGNIRELENVIEQAVIISPPGSPLLLGRQLINKSIPTNTHKTVEATNPKTLNDVKRIQQETEREYILSVLRKTNGKIRGVRGAAELLNIKPTTLESRMEKLGISKDDITFQ